MGASASARGEERRRGRLRRRVTGRGAPCRLSPCRSGEAARELPRMIRRLPLRPLLFAALAAVVVAFGAPGGATAQGAQGRDWPEILEAADGQAVYWNAWGGDPRINAYIAWVHDQVKP